VKLWLALIGALVVEIVVYAASQHDILAADPLWYADIAHDLTKHASQVLQPGDLHPITMRVGLTLPLALLYWLFGVSTFVTNLPSLFSALGIIAIAFAAPVTPRGKLIGLGLALACVPMLHQLVMLNTDLPCGALMAWSVLLVVRRRYAIAMAVWFAAFLVKESALWLAPVWIYVAIVELRASDLRMAARTFAPALVVGGVLGIAYLYVCARVWGDPFARFKGIAWSVGNVGESQTYGPAFVRSGSSAGEWFARLTWKVPWLLGQMFTVTLVPALVAPVLVRGRNVIWLVATAVVIVLYWFGSSTFSAYMPLPIGARMIVPGLPFVLVTAALGAEAALDRISASLRDAARSGKAGPFDRFPGKRWVHAGAGVLAIAIAVLQLRALRSTIGQGHPETDAFALVRDDAASGQRVVVVCGEPRCAMVGRFYFGLDTPPNVTLIFATDFAAQPLPEHALVRALVDVPRAAGMRRSDPRNDRTAPIDALALPRLYWRADVHLYDAGDGARLWHALQ
jgi:hypothetical protein